MGGAQRGAARAADDFGCVQVIKRHQNEIKYAAKLIGQKVAKGYVECVAA